MIIRRHRQFIKNYKKRILPNSQLDKRFEERLELFHQDRQNPLLKNHKLIGSMEGLRAFSVTGDIRVVYRAILEII